MQHPSAGVTSPLEATLSESPKLALLVQSGSHNRLHAMVSLTSTAVAMGGEVHIFLTHEALKAYLTGTLDEAAPDFSDPEYQDFYQEAVELERTPNLSELLEESCARGPVKIYGCQASIALWRGYSTEALNKLEAIIGHTTFLKIATGKQLLFL